MNERPKPPQQEGGMLHSPDTGKRIQASPEEVRALREHLAASRVAASEGLSRAEMHYGQIAREAPQEQKQALPQEGPSLQEVIQKGDVIIDGTAQGDEFKRLRDELKRQTPASPTQTTGGIFQRIRNLFR